MLRKYSSIFIFIDISHDKFIYISGRCKGKDLLQKMISVIFKLFAKKKNQPMMLSKVHCHDLPSNKLVVLLPSVLLRII